MSLIIVEEEEDEVVYFWVINIQKLYSRHGLFFLLKCSCNAALTIPADPLWFIQAGEGLKVSRVYLDIFWHIREVISVLKNFQHYSTHVTAFWWCRRKPLKSVCIIQLLVSTFNKWVWCWITDLLPDSGHIKKPRFPVIKVHIKGFILRQYLD